MSAESSALAGDPVALLARPTGTSLRGRHAHRWAILVVLCSSVVIVNLDNTILNVALPTLVRKLHATSSELQWIVDSYAMVFAGLVLVGGSLADRFGRKRFFLIGFRCSRAGSIGAAFSGSVDVLIAWRAMMGVGAALTIPASLSIINDVFRDPAERARAIGAWAATDRARDRARSDRRRPAALEVLVGLGVSRQRPDRDRCAARGPVLVPDSRTPRRPARPGRRGAVDRRPRPRAVGDHRGVRHAAGPRWALSAPAPAASRRSAAFWRGRLAAITRCSSSGSFATGVSPRLRRASPRGLRPDGGAVRADAVRCSSTSATRRCRPGCGSCRSPRRLASPPRCRRCSPADWARSSRRSPAWPRSPAGCGRSPRPQRLCRDLRGGAARDAADSDWAPAC